MDTNMNIKFDETKYNSDEIDRTTSHNPTTVIKYITPRIIRPSISTNFQESLRGIESSSNINSNYPPTITTHGLATLVHPVRFSTISSIHSINGTRIIDELRELSRITETLANTILEYCNLEAHTRAQQLQIEWLENHSHENGTIIEKKYQTEMESAQKLINDNLQQKSISEIKLNEISRTIIVYDEQYKQLLSKRNLSSKELFDLERQIAQNNVESQFLKRRIHNFDDEIKFYILKNRILYDRKVRLRYEFDQELFSHQSLKLEIEILENDKITNEDIHSASLDDIQKSIDTSQLTSLQPSKYFSQQLNSEVQRIREEHEKKLEIYREELHRKFEFELYRYQIQKSSSIPIVTKEHELKLEQYQHENNDIQQQIGAVRGGINQIIIQIESIEKEIISKKTTQQSSIIHTKKYLDNLNQLIRDRERQLEDTLRIRNSLKEEIEYHRKRFERYSSKQKTHKRASMHEMNYLSTQKPISRLSLQESLNNTNQYSKVEDLWEEGTLIRFEDFNIDQDCNELHRLLSDSNIDEGSIIRILCNRSTGQRLQIREKYQNLFQQNLDYALERLINKNLSQFLRILLLSPIERDCFELRRILTGHNIDINILAEIIFTRSNKHIQMIRDNYQTLFKSTLEQDIISKENTPMKQIYLELIQSNRSDENNLIENDILKDARNLHETESKWKTNESIFLRLLCTRSNLQLKHIFSVYRQFSEIDIEQAIQIHMNENLQQTFLTIVRILRNRSQFFANELKNNIKGTTTNIDNLNRIIISRCEIDMIQIKNEYEKMFKRTLYDHIQTEINGNYKRALLELIRQRIESTTKDLSSRNFHEQIQTTRTQSSIHWEKPIIRVSSDTFNKPRFTRCSKFDHNKNRSFDSNNHGKSNSLSTITTRKPRSNYTNQHVFIPMQTTSENHSE